MKADPAPLPPVPWFGARKMARALSSEVQDLRAERDGMREQIDRLGILTILQLESRRADLEREIAAQGSRLEQERSDHALRLDRERSEQESRLKQERLDQASRLERERSDSEAALQTLKRRITEASKTVVATEDLVLLQEAGVYHYRHPLTDAVAYEKALAKIDDEIKTMTRKDGGAVLAAIGWTVNGSAAEGRALLRDFSKLMLRAFNAEADNLVRGLKPFKLAAATDRLQKVADTIERLGKTMQIRISSPYFRLRVRELELTADFLQKQAEEKEVERAERERLREERKVQQEIERERMRLEKERQHYENVLASLVAKGDEAGAARLQDQLSDVQRAIEDVDYRAANIRAGYVYVISNIGSFGERMVKVGMTRRLDPMDRIRELSDASVPFNFDIHALFFSQDAVGIETAMHERLAGVRVNIVNRRREFFRATPLETKAHLADLAGELLQFQDLPEALEYRQGLTRAEATAEPQEVA
ncbi:MAG TPA: DUF4041 domain-containing protein [Thermoanaerobaculia bacterium]|nr:DUF4041 domain-containing protein [Thermoanaerobaculia bacterium]